MFSSARLPDGGKGVCHRPAAAAFRGFLRGDADMPQLMQQSRAAWRGCTHATEAL